MSYLEAGYTEYLEKPFKEEVEERIPEVSNLDIEALVESIPASIIVPEVELA